METLNNNNIEANQEAFSVNAFGVEKKWRENGPLKNRSAYDDVIRSGTYEARHDNGRLMYCQNYKNGKLEGISEWWYDNGQMMS